MKIKGKQEKEDALELYVIDTVHEHKTYDIFHKYAIDNEKRHDSCLLLFYTILLLSEKSVHL